MLGPALAMIFCLSMKVGKLSHSVSTIISRPGMAEAILIPGGISHAGTIED